MGTVDKKIADRIVKNNGYYELNYDGPDNPQYGEITEYVNMAGEPAYGLTVKDQENVYTLSEYVRNPRCYWKLKED